MRRTESVTFVPGWIPPSAKGAIRVYAVTGVGLGQRLFGVIQCACIRLTWYKVVQFGLERLLFEGVEQVIRLDAQAPPARHLDEGAPAVVLRQRHAQPRGALRHPHRRRVCG